MTKLTAKLSVRNADEAITFYQRALGATCAERYTAGGAVVFSRLEVDGAELEVKDGDQTDPAIEDLGGSPILFTLDVDDAQAAFDRMVEAGATVRFALDEQVYGMLQGRVVDPFGVLDHHPAHRSTHPRPGPAAGGSGVRLNLGPGGTEQAALASKCPAMTLAATR